MMDFHDGELVRVCFMAKAASIENGSFKMALEPTEQKRLAIIVSGNGLSIDSETVEFVPAAHCYVPVEKRNSTLLQLVEPYFEQGLSVDCGLISTSSKASIEKLNHSISDSNLCLIRNCVQLFLSGKM